MVGGGEGGWGGGVIECLIDNSYFFYDNFFWLSIFCRVLYCVIFIVAVGTLLFVIKLIRENIHCKLFYWL